MSDGDLTRGGSRSSDVFALTKLVVGDLEAARVFYGEVCGLREAQRISGEVEGRPMTELIMRSDSPSAATLVLLTFHDARQPVTGECMLVFETRDLAAFVQRAITAGGSLMQAPKSLPEFGLSFAFVRDGEGHMVEAIQRHG